MITREAIYTYIETLIGNPANIALANAVSFRNLRGSVDEAEKVVRVDCVAGEHCMTTEDMRKELRVKTTIQCLVSPSVSDDDMNFEIALDAAKDASFDMSREIFEAVATDTSLAGLVCDSYFSEFETNEAKMGSLRRGVTFLDGIINQAS